jgi:hypothetical protein
VAIIINIAALHITGYIHRSTRHNPAPRS